LGKTNGDGGWNGGESTYYLQNGNMNSVRNGGGWVRTSGTSLIDDAWHHVVFINDAGANTVYIDGSPATLSVTDFNNNDNVGNHVRLGWSNNNDGSNTYTGLLDEVAIWSRVLSPTEVSDL